MVEVSIIVPVFNRKDRLPKVVESLLLQKFTTPYEVILVDDGSTDGCCEPFYGIEQLRVIKQKNSGAAVARNTGVLSAKGDIVVFHDSDDIAEDSKLAVLTKALYDNPSCVASFGVTKEEREGWKPPPWIANVDSRGYCIFQQPLSHFMKRSYPLASAMNIAMKKNIAIYATSNSNKYKAANDFHMQAKAATRGQFVGVNKELVVYFQDSKNSLTKQFGTERQLMFSLLSSVETYNSLKKSEKRIHKQSLKDKITNQAPTAIVSLIKKRELGLNLLKIIYYVMKYANARKLPRTFYWALQADKNTE